MRAHLRSKGHLTPALKAIRRTRAERFLQWRAENMHENILFTDEKLLTIEELYNNQNKKIYSQTSLEMCSEGAGRPSNLLRHGFVGGVPSGGDTSSFLLERGEIDIRVYQEDVLQEVVKQLNVTFFIGQKWVFQQDSVPAQKSRLLRSGCGGTIWPSSVLRFGFGECRPQNPGQQNYGLFSMTWRAESVTTAWRA